MMKLFNLSVMDRYLIRELTPPFFLSLGMFSSVGVAIAMLSDLMNKIFESDLSWFLALKVMLLKVPEFVCYALPISVLLTTLIGYGRLSKDSELIALRSFGISLFRLILPGLILGILVTTVTFLFHELVVPETNYQATSILVKNLNEQRKFLLRNDIFYPEYEEVKLENGDSFKKLKTLFYAKKFDGKDMNKLTVLMNDKSGLNNIIVSEKGVWDQQEKAWNFFHGVIYQLNADASYRKSSYFDEEKFSLPKTPLELAIQSRDPYEMNIVQAKKYLELLQLLGNEKTILMFEVRIAQKIAFPFVCLMFALIGSVLGSRPNINSKATSFSWCVGIVFCYYLSGFFIGSLGLVGVITPFIAAWLPNFLGFGIGYFLFINSNK
jgi:lipopolysaccharide export system permease protein